MRQYLYFILFNLLAVNVLLGQQDSLRSEKMDEVEVYSLYRDNLNTGASVITYDSSILAQHQNTSIADLFASEGGVFIKSYGLGSLATSSVRGAGAHHTKVLWNGFDISNPMLGQVDFSYLNTDAFDDISLQLGNTNGLYGDGTQGGVVKLNNKLLFNNPAALTYHLNTGSFGLFTNNVNYKSGSKNTSTSLNIHQLNADNDFTYNNANKVESRENADVNEMGITLTNGIKINKYESITTGIWFQQNERGIPVAINASNKDERLRNEFFRSMLGWNRFGSRNDYRVSTAYFVESLDYTNPTADISNASDFRKWISEGEYKKRLNGYDELILGANVTNIESVNPSYIGTPYRTSVASFIGVKGHFMEKRLVVTPTLRKEFVNDFEVPFTGSLGSRFMIVDYLFLTGSFSKNYRLPTFNDLYFGPYGNHELRPESGYSAETSVEFQKNQNTSRFTVYQNDYVDWISWQPSVGGVWRPQNNDVLTRGVEWYNKLQFDKFFIRSNLNYTLAMDLSTGNQLIYVPLYTGNMTTGYSYKLFTLSYTHALVGERFITSTNSVKLLPYQLGSIMLSKTLNLGDAHGRMAFRVQNLYDREFQVIAGQPMPGRSYEITFALDFKQKTKNDL